jgi:hypothetical protein
MDESEIKTSELDDKNQSNNLIITSKQDDLNNSML